MERLLAACEKHGVGDVEDDLLAKIVESIDQAVVPPLFLPGRLTRALLRERLGPKSAEWTQHPEGWRATVPGGVLEVEPSWDRDGEPLAVDWEARIDGSQHGGTIDVHGHNVIMLDQAIEDAKRMAEVVAAVRPGG